MSVVSWRVGLLSLLMLSFGAVTPVRGALPPEADGLFQEGRAALLRDDFMLAASYFDRSYRLEPTLGTLLNLAFCKEKLGKLTAALEHLEKARATAPPADRRLPLIEQRIAQLKLRVPRLTVRPSASLDASVTISLDQRPLASSDLGRAIRVDPGKHVLDCAGPHAPTCSNELSISEGDDVVLVVTSTSPPIPSPHPYPAPQSASTPHPASAPPLPLTKRPSPPDHRAAYFTGGVGLATVVAGLIAGAGAIRQKNVFDAHCDDRGCDAEGMNAARTGATLATVSTVATAIGVTTMGVSVYLLLKPPTPAGAVSGLSIAGSF